MKGLREPLAARLARALRRDRRQRPRYPGVQRTLETAAVVLAIVVALDLYSAHVVFLPSLGMYYVALVVFITLWTGLPGGLACCAVLTAHVWFVYHFPVSVYGPQISLYNRKPLDPRGDVVATAIAFPVYAAIMALVHLVIFRGAVRAYDAQASADAAAYGLRTSEAMRRVIVDASTDAVVVFGEDGAIRHWNPHAKTLFGWTEDEALGQTLGATILPPRLVGPHLRTLLRGGEGADAGQRLETQAATRDGEDLDVEATVVPHRREDEAVYIAFFHDIGERKRAEAAIRELNAELEARVAERTAQLEAANAELAGFNHSVSHDLRAPLRSIVANSRMLVEDAGEALDVESRDRLHRMETAARKMDRLIASLLEFSRVGQTTLRPREVDLSATMQAVADDLRANHGGDVSVEPGLVACADPELLSLVAQNLMDNAWKYVAPGEAPRVEVGQRPDGAFFVRDHGVGFDMANVEKVWQPFERLHHEAEYPGTGIGLANCRRIVRRHGGDMWAESKVGEGTTVFFILPRGVGIPPTSATPDA